MEEDFNHFEQVYQELDQKIGELVRVTALKIEAKAKRSAPVDTGFLRQSIYTTTEGGSDFAGASAAAKKRGAKRNKAGSSSAATLFPPVPAPMHNQAVIAVGATYGIFLEFGTSRMAARPFLTPALEAYRYKYLRALKQLSDGEFNVAGGMS